MPANNHLLFFYFGNHLRQIETHLLHFIPFLLLLIFHMDAKYWNRNMHIFNRVEYFHGF